MSAPVLLDVTRSITRKWSGRSPTGIDRVCDAYFEHFAYRSRAVIQVGGRALIMGKEGSRKLVEACQLSQGEFRKKLVGLVVRSVLRGSAVLKLQNGIYINVGHTEVDRQEHLRWTRKLRLRAVYLLHDLIPITHPQVTTPHKASRHRNRVINALGNAAGIVVNSETTRETLERFACENGLASPPVLRAHIASPVAQLEAIRASGSRPYFVAIGTIEPRKNYRFLLRLWSRLIDRMGKETPRLVIVGQRGLRAVQELSLLSIDPRLTDHVEVRENVPDAVVASLLGNALALVLPSQAEGFGLPLIEALAMRVPVIANDLPAFREIGGPIPTLLDTANEDLWLEHIIGFASHSPELKRQQAAMIDFQVPVWQEHFAKVDAWLAELADRDEVSQDKTLAKEAWGIAGTGCDGRVHPSQPIHADSALPQLQIGTPGA